MTLPPDFAAELATKYLALAERTKANRLVLIYIDIRRLIADAEASGTETTALAAHCHAAAETLRENEEARFWIRSDKSSNEQLLIEAEPKLRLWITLPLSSLPSADLRETAPKQPQSESGSLNN